MSETFKASNGVDVSIREESDGTFLLSKGGVIEGGVRRWTVATGNAEGIVALREFFQHERDKELGRWRWPENPNYVVYKAPAGERVPDARHVTVSNESNGEAAWLFEVGSGGVSGGDSWARDAARDYFAAHPEPKPWMEVPEGVYAMRPDVHLYERLIMFRAGKWHHLYKRPSEADSDPYSEEPEKIAETAFREGRLTRLVAEVPDA